MCCFSGKPGVIEAVTNTNIFARMSGDRQLLAYSMSLAATEPVAMILPLPVPPGSPEDAVRFIDLSAYDRLFKDLDKAFPPMVFPAPAALGPASRSAGAIRTLEVHKVGRFEASFVPALADFARVDERFRISDEVWRALPQYADYGFCVFKLTDLKRSWWRSPKRTIHPMAFEFPRRDPAALFFPTVHVHDGAVEAQAQFDHMLYYQAEEELAPDLPPLFFRQMSDRPARATVQIERAGGLVDGDAQLRRMMVTGQYPNRDLLLT
jgi:hypothetical protein